MVAVLEVTKDEVLDAVVQWLFRKGIAVKAEDLEVVHDSDYDIREFRGVAVKDSLRFIRGTVNNQDAQSLAAKTKSV